MRFPIDGDSATPFNFRVQGAVVTPPGFTLQPQSTLTTTESGATAVFTVRLNTAPAADVTRWPTA